jgi:hypothetical protein
MKHPLMLLGTTALVMLSIAGSLAQEKYTLVYRFQPGATYLYADTSRSNQTQEMMGQEMKILSVSSMRTRMVCEGVKPEGPMTLISSLDSMTVAMKSPMRDTTMVLTDLLGKRTRITLAPGGAVLSREVVDSLKATGMMARGMSAREGMKFHRMSKDPVSVGSTWKSDAVDSTDMMGGKMVSHITMDYSVTAKAVCVGRSCLQIGYKGEISLEGKGSMMGMDLFMEGKGKTAGTLFFDPAAGVLVQEVSSTDSDVTAAVTGQQNMTIPISSSLKATRVLLSVEGGNK